MKFRLLSSPNGSSTPARVDREKRVIYGVSLLQEGEALGHRMLVDQTMLKQCVDAVNATGGHGMKSRFTHPGMCDDGMGRQLGKIKNARVDGEKAVGDLHLADFASAAPDGDLATYVMDLADESPEDFGLSIAFDGSRAWKVPADNGAFAEVVSDERPSNATTKFPFARITKLRAVDAVDEPAANRDGLFAAAFASTSNEAAAEAFDQLDAMRERMGLSIEKASDFLTRYLSARGAQPAQPISKEPTMSLDATKLSALYDQHPKHVKAIGEAFRAGKDEAAIVAMIGESDRSALAAENAQLKADALAAKTEAETKLSAIATKLADVEKRYGQLSSFSAGGKVDPGADAHGGTERPTQEGLKAEWEALPAAKQVEFCNSFDAFAFARQNPAKVAPNRSESATGADPVKPAKSV